MTDTLEVLRIEPDDLARQASEIDNMGRVADRWFTRKKSVIYAPDVGKIQQRFSDLVVFLDTPVLLRSLGLTSDVQAEAARELVYLAKSLGADVAFLPYTRAETLSVLTTSCDQLRSARRSSVHNDRGLRRWAVKLARA